MPRKAVIAAVLAVAAFSHASWAESVAPAAPPPADPASTVVESLTVDTLATILQDAGAEEVAPSAAERFVRFKSGTRNFLVALSSCNEKGEECALVTIGRGVKSKLPLEVLNKLNGRYRGLIAANRGAEDTFTLFHASILSGGVTRKNIAVNLVWFVNESQAFADFIQSQLVASIDPSAKAIASTDTPQLLGEFILSAHDMKQLLEDTGFPDAAQKLKFKSR
jgi:hypothetical protein